MKALIVIIPSFPEEFRLKMADVLDKHAEIGGKLLRDNLPNHHSVHHAVALHRLFVPNNFVMN